MCLEPTLPPSAQLALPWLPTSLPSTSYPSFSGCEEDHHCLDDGDLTLEFAAISPLTAGRINADLK